MVVSAKAFREVRFIDYEFLFTLTGSSRPYLDFAQSIFGFDIFSRKYLKILALFFFCVFMDR